MNRMLMGSLLAAVVLAGCATTPPAPSPAGSQTRFTGEVWTWDEQAGTVTLRQGERIVRITVPPDQLRGLRLHETATVRGELAPPTEILHITPPGVLELRGAAQETEVTGTVSAIDPAGLVVIDTPGGPLRLWVATPGAQPFQTGDPVRVRVRVQPLQVVQAQPGQAAASEPSASVGPEPGEYAVVRGRITAVGPGQITVESQRGPVTASPPAGGRYVVGDWIELRTSVHPVR
jgi:hypothetical protein